MFLRALRNMRQSPVLCTAAIGTVAVSLIILAFFALIVINVQLVTGHWSREIEITAYLDRLPEDRELYELIAEIRQRPEVAGVNFISQRQAFERFRQRLKQEADLLDGLEADILPASLEITLNEIYRTRQGVEELLSALKKNPRLSDLRYGQDWLERFEAFLGLLRLAGGVLGGFLLFAALFIVSNTIKLTLYARRDELEVMALVGATPLFVKVPFLLEGAIQGMAGGVLAIGGTFLIFEFFLREGLQSVLLITGPGGIHFLPLAWQLGLLSIGVLLGLFGSALSLRKLVRI
jgi:cell division transport system permease protein